MPKRPNLVLLKPVAEGEIADVDEDVVDATGDHYRRVGADDGPGLVWGEQTESAYAPRTIKMADPERYRRQQVRRRRRDILALLLGTTVFTGLLGIVPSLHILWALTVVGAIALVGYVGLAVYALQTPGAESGVARGRGLHRAGVQHRVDPYFDDGAVIVDDDAYEYGYEEPERRVASR
jgi:hypothetical protein